MSLARDDAKLDAGAAALMARASGPRRARRPRARQRPLPDELLGDEGLRRRRLPARGRADADRARGLSGDAGGRAWTSDIRSSARLRRARPPAADARARSTLALEAARPLRARRPRALARHAGGRPDGRRADDVHARPGSTRSRTPSTRRRCSPRPARSRPSRRSSGCGSRTRSPPRRWSTSRELRPGMKESEAAAIWQGFVHGEGTAGRARSSSRSGSRSSGRGRGSGRSPRPATGRCRSTSRRCSRSGCAPTATGATTRRTLCPGELDAALRRAARRSCSSVYGARSTTAGRARASPSSTGSIRDGLADGGLPGPAVAPDRHGVGARAHEPPYAHQAGGGHDRGGHGARDRARRLLGGRRRPAPRGQLPDHRATAPRSCRRFPDGLGVTVMT